MNSRSLWGDIWWGRRPNQLKIQVALFISLVCKASSNNGAAYSVLQNFEINPKYINKDKPSITLITTFTFTVHHFTVHNFTYNIHFTQLNSKRTEQNDITLYWLCTQCIVCKTVLQVYLFWLVTRLWVNWRRFDVLDRLIKWRMLNLLCICRVLTKHKSSLY